MASDDPKEPNEGKRSSHEVRLGASDGSNVQSAKVTPLISRNDAAPRPESSLLDAARMQWQFGDWDTLAALSTRAISSDPERAKLALLAACAWQHKGNHIAAREFLAHAISWGCDRRLAARFLISSIHVTLGRAAALQGDERRALNHFRESTKGLTGDPRLSRQARTVRELMRLGLVQNGSDFTQAQDVAGAMPAQAGDEQTIPSKSVSPRANCTPSLQTRKTGAPGRPFVLVAGMRHSGSTAAYNLIRVAMKNAGVTFISGYAENADTRPTIFSSETACLVKIHEYRDDIAGMANLVITTRRDLRDTVASASRRKFPAYRAHGGAIAYARYNRSLHDIWASRSDYEFVYERFVRSPVQVIEEVLSLVGLDLVDATSVLDEIRSLPTDDYKTTLLSPTHITDPQRAYSYADTLGPEEVKEIEEQHFEWLSRFEYELSGISIEQSSTRR